MVRPETEQTYQERMLTVLVHIQQHLDRTPSLEELARVAFIRHVGPYHEVGVQEIEARDYAATHHRGPYENLSETYARVCGQWLPTSGREAAAAPCLEFYMNSPENTPPADLMTEVCVPLKER